MGEAGRKALHFGGWWAALFALWLLLAGSASGGELAAGAVAAALAAGVLPAEWACDPIRFRPRLRWLLRVHRLALHAANDTWVLTRALVRALAGKGRLAGRSRRVHVEPGGRQARGAARRALIIAAVSFGPNSYVLAMSRRRKLVRIHQLEPTGEGIEELT